MSADVQHVDSGQELVSDLVGERIDVSRLVGEFAPLRILIGGGDASEPKG